MSSPSTVVVQFFNRCEKYYYVAVMGSLGLDLGLGLKHVGLCVGLGFETYGLGLDITGPIPITAVWYVLDRPPPSEIKKRRRTEPRPLATCTKIW